MLAARKSALLPLGSAPLLRALASAGDGPLLSAYERCRSWTDDAAVAAELARAGESREREREKYRVLTFLFLFFKLNEKKEKKMTKLTLSRSLSVSLSRARAAVLLSLSLQNSRAPSIELFPQEQRRRK